MRENSDYENDDMQDEYDFTRLQIVKRGPGRKPPVRVTVELEPDVAEAFSNSVVVNEALRFLIRITKDSSPQIH